MNVHTVRMLNADVTEMRARYLGELAHLCSSPPPVVDAMRYRDFYALCLWIDGYNEAVKKSNEG